MRALVNLKEDKLLFFDIETAPLVKELEQGTPLYDSWAYKVNKEGDKTPKEIIDSYSAEAGLYPEFAKVICVTVGKIKNDKINLITFNDADEKTLLEGLNDKIDSMSGDTLVGFVNTGFDSPFLFKRMIINGIESSSKLDSSGLKPWEVEEIDLSKIWQGTSFSRASLLNISTALGLPSPKDDISGADVGKVYWDDPIKGLERISTYCSKDVVTTINVFRKMVLREPLEVGVSVFVNSSAEDIAFENDDVVQHLFNGGRYLPEHKKKLIALLKEMSDDDRERAYTILDSVTSTAAGKKTKLTKAHVKALREEV